MSVIPGEVYLADIFEGGVRPVAVVSREQLNGGGLYLTVPITSARDTERHVWPSTIDRRSFASTVGDSSAAPRARLRSRHSVEQYLVAPVAPRTKQHGLPAAIANTEKKPKTEHASATSTRIGLDPGSRATTSPST